MLPGDPNRALMEHKDLLDKLLKYTCVGSKGLLLSSLLENGLISGRSLQMCRFFANPITYIPT